jgi:hypothetical protein
VANAQDASIQVTTRARSVAPDYAKSALVVSTTFSNLVEKRLGDATVTVKYRFRVLTPVASMILGSDYYEASGTCVMKVE